jgi:hypothetical protein
VSKYEIEYETGDSWWWQATEPTLAAAKQRVAELSARFPTRDWRIKMDGKVLDNED